ncbi:MAG: type I restriction endonuclease, partial [Candidatus Poribacteria bacterium]|nr:type I restriction endonuclease [Candidatus Poribacteria bacterium]
MSERDAVQNPMLRYADEIGWECVSASQALRMRGGDTNLYFADPLETQLLKLNRDVLDEALCKEILRQLNLLHPTLEGNREALAWLRGERSIFVPDQERERNVTLIDFETLEGNLFHVTDEWWHRSTAHRNRADVVFLVNGIPVAVVETKSAHKRDGLAEGVDQIRRYHRETPEMFTTAQLFGVTQLLDFFYGVTWNTSRKNLFNWKADDPANYEEKVKTFFDPARLLKTLRESIIFLSRDDELTKVVLRQHQT